MRDPRVVIVQRYITHYRVPFLDRLRQDLADAGVKLELVHGFPWQETDASKQDTATVPWATTVRNHWVRFGSRPILLQPAMKHLRGADLVIVEQASARALNYRLFVSQLAGRTRMAFWGHGKNFKGETASPAGEWAKRVMSTRVHWWFAYNRMSGEIVRALGYPRERITDVQNAIDTQQLLRAREGFTGEDSAVVRAELDLPQCHVGVYVGGMYPEKRLDFLVAAAKHVRRLVPDFALVLMGAGPDAHIARQAAAVHEWVHYPGPRFGTDKVPYMAVADLFLMPGLVGLALLDSFALETPIVTTQDAPHSPEIDYLEHGRNGIMLPAGTTPDGYAREIVRLLHDPDTLKVLRAGCREAADRYTVEEMSARFTDGVLAALSAPRFRRRMARRAVRQ